MELNLKIPDDIYLALKLPEGHKEKILMIELAVSLYERGYLSFGKARQLSNLTKWEFHDELGRRKIERHYDINALEEDLECSHDPTIKALISAPYDDEPVSKKEDSEAKEAWADHLKGASISHDAAREIFGE